MPLLGVSALQILLSIALYSASAHREAVEWFSLWVGTYDLVILQPDQWRSCSCRVVYWKAEIRQEKSTKAKQWFWWPSWKRESKLWWLSHAEEIKVSCIENEGLYYNHFGFPVFSFCAMYRTVQMLPINCIKVKTTFV